MKVFRSNTRKRSPERVKRGKTPARDKDRAVTDNPEDWKMRGALNKTGAKGDGDLVRAMSSTLQQNQEEVGKKKQRWEERRRERWSEQQSWERGPQGDPVLACGSVVTRPTARLCVGARAEQAAQEGGGKHVRNQLTECAQSLCNTNSTAQVYLGKY